MTPEQRGLVFRSNPETYQLGNTIPIKMEFLAQSRQMAAPEVHALTVEFRGTVGAISGGALGRDAAKLFDVIRFKDADEVLNCSGAGLRVLEQLEWGGRQIDPADIASGATNTAYIYRLRIDFAPERCVRPRDFAIPVAHFLEGGEFLIGTPSAVPTGWAAVQSDWKVRVFADVRDGRTPEAKSRRRIKEQAISLQEFDYEINGFIRSAVITSKLTTTGYTDLSAFANVYSRTLKLPPTFETHMLVDRYRRGVEGAPATHDEFCRAATGAIPLVVPDAWQRTGQMIDTRTLHLDLLAAAPAGGRLITDTLIDRSAELTAMDLGYPSAGELQQAAQSMGVVKGEASSYKVRGFNAALARKMPFRIEPGSGNGNRD